MSTGGANSTISPVKKTAYVPYTGASDSISTASNMFGKKLLLELLKEKPLENAVISPVSIEVALAMAGEGAVGETRKELFNVLGISLEGEELEKAYKEFVSRVFGAEANVEVIVANSLWVKDSIEQSYKEMARDVFDAEVNQLTTAEPINKWAADKTRDKITHVVDQIGPHTNILIANAIYFKGTWGSVFYKGSNEKRPFYVAEKERTAVEFMVKAEQMFYYEDENVQVVDLPYQSNKWFARIVLPKKSLAENGKTSLDVLLKTDFEVTSLKMTFKQGVLKLPRFTVRFGPASISDTLKAIGLQKAFSPGEFTKMSTVNQLSVSNVIHAAVMEVTEEGTVAAAVTVVECDSEECEDSGDEPFEMVVDRPFLFSIMYREPATALFLSAVYNIEQ